MFNHAYVAIAREFWQNLDMPTLFNLSSMLGVSFAGWQPYTDLVENYLASGSRNQS